MLSQMESKSNLFEEEIIVSGNRMNTDPDKNNEVNNLSSVVDESGKSAKLLTAERINNSKHDDMNMVNSF